MRLLRYIVLVLFVAVPSVTLADTIPAFPMAFWGNVTINGSAAPVGTIVRAYYWSTLAGSVTVQSVGVYGYTSPTQQKLVLGEGTGAISFTVQTPSFYSGVETTGDSPVTYSGFSSGATIQKDLAFIYTAPAQGSGGGGGGGSSGGGGGGGVVASVTTTTTTSTTTLKGDANGDGTVGLLDFNTLLVDWGKKGTGIAADFNGDGVVDIFDFNQLLINWGK